MGGSSRSTNGYALGIIPEERITTLTVWPFACGPVKRSPGLFCIIEHCRFVIKDSCRSFAGRCIRCHSFAFSGAACGWSDCIGSRDNRGTWGVTRAKRRNGARWLISGRILVTVSSSAADAARSDWNLKVSGARGWWFISPEWFLESVLVPHACSVTKTRAGLMLSWWNKLFRFIGLDDAKWRSRQVNRTLHLHEMLYCLTYIYT